MEQVARIELASAAWKAAVIAVIRYLQNLVGAGGGNRIPNILITSEAHCLVVLRQHINKCIVKYIIS